MRSRTVIERRTIGVWIAVGFAFLVAAWVGATGFAAEPGEVAIAADYCHSLALRAKPVPQLLDYQGRLNDSFGHPLDGVTVDLTFLFYDDEEVGKLLLTDQHIGVQITEGLFNVLIGSGTVTPGMESTVPDVFRNHNMVWITTEVGSDGEMTPRQLIVPAAYAINAGSAADLTHIVPQSTAPANPSKGMVYMDDSTNTLMVYDGTTWQACW